jgi:glutamyl-tRNA reductase
VPRFETMQQDSFRSLSISYKTAPLEIRERLALTEDESDDLIGFIKEQGFAKELMILSTCNRTEIYYTSDEDIHKSLIQLLSTRKGIQTPEDFATYFSIVEGFDAVRHLFRVSLGLEAQVAGDLQISNQVKRAYQQSANLEMAGPFLHRLMHTIFYANKRVVQETPFRDGAASVSYATAELVEELTHNIYQPYILVLGLGEIGADVARNLKKLESDQVYLCNRTLEKADELAHECGFKVLPFEDLNEGLMQAHVIVSSVSLPQAIISKQRVEDAGGVNAFKFFIDLSVPRSVEKEVSEIPGAFVYNIDQIRSKVNEVQAQRMASIPKVEAIMEEMIADFGEWKKEMTISPTIQKLKDALETIRKEELSRYLKNLEPQEVELLEKVSKGMMQKFLKMPVLQLKAACRRGDPENLIETLTDLFDLEKVSKKS